MTQPTEYEQASYNSPDGIQIGRTASSMVGFFGTAPAVRNATSSGAMTTTIGAALGTQTASAGGFGASTAAIMTSTFAQVNALMVDMASAQALANNLRTTLVNLGLMKGS